MSNSKYPKDKINHLQLRTARLRAGSIGQADHRTRSPQTALSTKADIKHRLYRVSQKKLPF